MRTVVMFGEGDEHVLVDADLAVEVEAPLLVGVEVVQIEVDSEDGLPVQRRFGGRPRGLSVEFSAAAPEWAAMCRDELGPSASASWGSGGRRTTRLFWRR
ncbi:hypothetical protein [Streptomyces sp. NRRL S-146]|uniref:hypothetical protein n=1 Tax=Streptomyces sp. NRRL S-146 TaxID=1463884 RepID=UPI0004C86668|nr:hypothetical protein [Streptomyces sp. NRRL S-146]